MSFVCMKTMGSEQANRWIGLSDTASAQTFAWSDESPVTFTNWGLGLPSKHAGDGPSCVYMDSTDGSWAHNSCSDNMGAICRTNQEVSGVPPDSYGCSLDQVAYRGSCYDINLSSLSSADAEAQCVQAGGHLLAISEEYEQAKMDTIIAETSDHFHLGLVYDSESQAFNWTSGEEYSYSNWAQDEPDLSHDNDGSGYCAYMHRYGDDVGKWRVVQCSQPYFYICETPRTGYTEPPPTTTTEAVGECQGFDWTGPANGQCYKAFDMWETYSGLNFDDAQSFCQTMTGGNLASIGDADEATVITTMVSLHYEANYWIGLRNGENGDGYYWLDGTPVGYLNWAEGEPNSEGSEDCVDLTQWAGYQWQDSNCDNIQGFVCEVAAGVAAPPTTLPPTHPPAQACGGDNGPEWQARPQEEQFCYAFYFDYYQTYNWRDAEQNCSLQGGRLASLHSPEENDWVAGEIAFLGYASGWIGLNRLYNDGHQWTDGTAFDYVNWADGEPNNAMGQESCVSTRASDGMWNDEMCTNKGGFVCKKPKEGGWTTPTTTPFPKGHCPSDWLEFEGRCYKFYGGGEFTGSDYYSLNWTDASAACRNNSITRMHNGNLASIHSPLQAAFLTAEAARFADEGWTFWTGLNSQLSWENTFTWSDETEVDFTNWASDEPNGMADSEHCVEMYSARGRAGQWNDKSCSDLKSYICEIRASEQYPEPPHPSWPACTDYQMAQQGFVSFRDNCYKVFPEEKTFAEAEAMCQSESPKAHLASIADVAEEDLAIVLSFPSDVWLGLTLAEHVWTWTDGWPLEYTNWFDSMLNNDTCVTLDDRRAKWFQTDCTKKNAYLCKWRNVTSPPPPPPAECPEGWLDVGGRSCYKFKQERAVTWHEANTDCWMEVGTSGRHGNLLSLHSEEEAGLVAQHTVDSMTNFWTGLARGWDSNFAWVDGSPYDLEFWLDNEPNSDGIDGEDCVEGYYATAQWNDAHCSDLKAWVCMTDKVVFTTPAPPAPTTPHTPQPTQPGDKTTPHTTHPAQDTTTRHTNYPTDPPTWEPTPTQDNGVETTPGPGSGMGGGGIAGLVIGLGVLVGLAAVLLVMLRNRNWEARRLLPASLQTSGSSSSPMSAFQNMSYNSGTGATSAQS